MKRSESINEFAKAFSAFQAILKPVDKDSTVKHTKFSFKFADLEAIWEAIRNPLTSQGLSVIQEAKTNPFGAAVTTLLMHSSGQWIEFEPLEIPASNKDAHGYGSAISYAKRYALVAALQAVSGDEDDDAKEAVKPPIIVKINQDMIMELNTLLDDCGEEYSKQIMNTLKNFNPPIRSFEDLPVQLYDRIKIAALKERDSKKVNDESTKE
jgi:hypothetical protein